MVSGSVLTYCLYLDHEPQNVPFHNSVIPTAHPQNEDCKEKDLSWKGGKIKIFHINCRIFACLPKIRFFYFQCHIPEFFMICFKSIFTKRKEPCGTSQTTKTQDHKETAHWHEHRATYQSSAFSPRLLPESSQRLAVAELGTPKPRQAPFPGPWSMTGHLTQFLWSSAEVTTH